MFKFLTEINSSTNMDFSRLVLALLCIFENFYNDNENSIYQQHKTKIENAIEESFKLLEPYEQFLNVFIKSAP